MGGKLIQNPPVIAPDGINDAMAVPKYITKAQLAKMNPYDHSPAKATQLLKSVGFTKKDGKWYTPKGDLWTVTITEQEGISHFDADGAAIVGMLTHFGVKARGGDRQCGDLELADARRPVLDHRNECRLGRHAQPAGGLRRRPLGRARYRR